MVRHTLAGTRTFTVETCFPTRFSLPEILVLAGTTGAGRMTPPTSARISARLKRVQGHVSPVNVCHGMHSTEVSI